MAFEKFQAGLKVTNEEEVYDHINNSLYNGVGHVLIELKNYKESIKYYQRSLEINRKLDNRPGIAHSINNIGNVYYYWEKYEEAFGYYEQALAKFNETGYKMGSAITLHNMGLVAEAMGDREKALEYFKEDLALHREIDHPAGIAESLNDIGELYIELGEFEKGEACLNQSLAMARKIQLQDVIYQNYFALSKLYEARGRDEEALIAYKKYVDCRDSVVNVETHDQVFSMQSAFEQEKIEKQISLLEKENELNALKIRQSQIMSFVIFGLSFLVFLSIFFLYRFYKLRTDKRMLILEQKLLRSQMNPHFIFNSLINIQGYILKKDPGNANRFIANFARLIRNILEYSRFEYVSVQKEIDTITNYLELQKLRFDDTFDYVIEIDENINTETMNIPPMLAQPFIENAIEHGIKPKEDKGHITIRFGSAGDMVRLEVEDDGIGREKARQIEKQTKQYHKSLATSITRERLGMMNRKRKQKIQLDIVDLKGPSGEVIGTKVMFEIPYR